MTQPKPSVNQLKKFRPFDSFTEKQMVLLAANSSIKEFPQEHSIFKVGDDDNLEYFLLKGSVQLESFDGRLKKIEADSESAKTALALLRPRKYNAKTETPCVFVLVEHTTVKTLLSELPLGKEVEFGVSDLHSGHEIQEIIQSFESDLRSNNLQIPSFPDVAFRIRKQLEDPNITVKDIAKILSSDPAITIKLLKTCSSPLYRTVSEITTVSDAIVRLGFDTTKQLVTIFAMKELFNSKNDFLQDKMRDLWLQSREVASISYVLAKITPGLNPEHAMLAGLLQDIGTIPVLNYIERYPNFMKLSHKVDDITSQLKSKLGAAILSAWDFQEDLVDVAKHSEDWTYTSEGPEASYTDLTLVAQIHTFIGKDQQNLLPNFDSMPAFRKLGSSGLTPEMSQEVLQESQQQLEDIQALLSPELIPIVI